MMRNLNDIMRKAREVSLGAGGTPASPDPAPPPTPESTSPPPPSAPVQLSPPAPEPAPVAPSAPPGGTAPPAPSAEMTFPAPIDPPAPPMVPESATPMAPLNPVAPVNPEPTVLETAAAWTPNPLAPAVPQVSPATTAPEPDPPAPELSPAAPTATTQPDPPAPPDGAASPGPRPPDGLVQDASRIDTLFNGGQPMTHSNPLQPGFPAATPETAQSRMPTEPQPSAPTGGPQGLQQTLGRGLDIGTANLVSAVQSESGIQLNLQRNAFIDVPCDVYTKSMLTRLGVPYAIQGDRLYVLGDASFELANIFGRETRRPMQRGLISPSEVDALPVIRLLIERVIGRPTMAGEPLYFSVPAEPIDSDLNVVYHEGIFSGLLNKLGFSARPIVEGHAVTLAELADDNFTGIGLSCGGGMFNACVSYKTIPALSFSTTRAGDWVDQNVAAVCGIPVSKATLIKEEGIDLMNPVGREQEAVSIYYRNLINYTLANIKHRFESSEGMPVFRDPITIVCSGGTALVGNFIACFQEEFQKVRFPIPVKEIRLADNPLMVVAKGALIAAALGDQ